MEPSALGSFAADVIISQRRKSGEVIPFTIETTAPLPGRPIKRQWEFITATATAIKLLCPRRVGKTVGVVKRVAKNLHERPGWRVLYINHTLENAKKQFFDPPGAASHLGLLGTLEHHGIGYTANRTVAHAELENGSFVQALGCDKISEVRKKLGYFWNEIIIDEIQEYSEELIDLLIRKALAPTLIQTHGILILSGTQPEVHDGFWWETINNPKYELFTWSMLDNPVITREGIAEEMGKAGFVVDFEHPENNHPIVQREVFCLAAIDPSSLMYEYVEGRNDIGDEGVPEPDSKTWRYAVGVDVGGAKEGNDKDAIVVLGWRTDDPGHKLYEREGWEGHSDSEEFATKVVDTILRWKPIVARCMDPGGGGTKYKATIEKRISGIEFEPKPTSADTRLLNDEFRSGRLKLNPKGYVAKAAKKARKGHHEPDAMAACRYAQFVASNYLGKKKEKKKETYDEYLERNIREQQRRRQQGLRGFWESRR